MAANIRLQALGLGLGDLAERERTRFLPAGLQVGFALGLGVAAVFIQDPGLRAALSLASAVNTARGVLQLSMSAHVGRAAEEFAGIEANNKAALFRKLHVGELGLAQAARVGKRQRIIAGCLGVVGAAGYLPLQLVLARRQDPGYRFGTVAGDYVGLSLSLIGLARSLVQALIKTPAERHYSEYRVLRRETMALP